MDFVNMLEGSYTFCEWEDNWKGKYENTVQELKRKYYKMVGTSEDEYGMYERYENFNGVTQEVVILKEVK